MHCKCDREGTHCPVKLLFQFAYVLAYNVKRVYGPPSLPPGSTSTDSTNHGSKIFLKNVMALPEPVWLSGQSAVSQPTEVSWVRL